MTSAQSAPRQRPADAAPAQPIAATIADFAAGITLDTIPAPVRECAKLHMLDAVGTALAATRFDFAHRALTGLRGLNEPGFSSLIGFSEKLPLRDAALMNGILIHGLDYDDTHPEAIVHPTASTLACALALGEHVDAHGPDLLAAYVAGVEIATRIGIAAHGAFHTMGFHTTGIAGHLACANVAGRLLGLNAPQIVMAQGIAGSTAAGSGEYRADGAWTKRMHPGWAAVGGITAAALARGGFTGPKSVYEGADGLFRGHAGANLGRTDLAQLTAGLGERWVIEEVAVKPFPICHILHACADSALALRRKHNLQPSQIREVRALLHPESFHYVAEPPALRRRPPTDYVAKFSVQYVVAACLVRGRFGFAELEPDALADAAILDMAERVSHDVDPDSAFPRYFSGGVVVRTTDGRELVHMEKVNRGAGDRQLTAEEICDKFAQNAGLAVSSGRADEIRATVLGAEQVSARELMRAVGGR